MIKKSYLMVKQNKTNAETYTEKFTRIFIKCFFGDIVSK